jgi:hypothetical protein
MMTKILLTSLVVGTAAFIGLADAPVAKAEPLQLTVGQLDSVTAGRRYRRYRNEADASALALAFGPKTDTYSTAATLTAPGFSGSLSYASSETSSGRHYRRVVLAR